MIFKNPIQCEARKALELIIKQNFPSHKIKAGIDLLDSLLDAAQAEGRLDGIVTCQEIVKDPNKNWDKILEEKVRSKS